MNIELHIEELVLEGFPPGDRQGIGGAVERELGRLLAERGLPGLTRSMDISSLDGGRLEMDRTATPEMVGGQVGGAVYGGMNLGR